MCSSISIISIIPYVFFSFLFVQLNQIAKVGSSRPVILSNGIKLHVQPKNLLMAANLAGVSPSAIQTTQVHIPS